MNKEKAVEYMIVEIEKLERERIAENMDIEPSRKKADTVAKILHILEGFEKENENNKH